MSDFIHRIDAVPKPGRRVEIVMRDGRTVDAKTERAPKGSGYGIGCEIQYAIQPGVIVTNQAITHWRYSGRTRAIGEAVAASRSRRDAQE